MLRHSNVNITQTFYMKSTGDDVRVAMEKIEQDSVAKALFAYLGTVTGL